MDKLIQICFRSIIRNLNGDMELSKEYEELALELHFGNKGICRVEDIIPREVKKRLYEMVS